MNLQLKQRIIGLFVIIALLSIFLPVLFHNTHPLSKLKLSGKVPKAPSTPSVQIQLPQPIPADTANNDQTAQPGTQPQNFNNAATQNTQPAMQQNTQPAMQQNTNNTPANTAEKQTPTTPATITPSTNPATAANSDTATANTNTQQANNTANTPTPPTITPSTPTTATTPRATTTPTQTNASNAIENPNLVASTLPTPTAWVIQLGTFSQKPNANRLVNKLRQKGYNAYIRSTTNSAGNQLTRVFVGPNINKNRLQQVSQQLRNQFKLNGVIIKYKV